MRTSWIAYWALMGPGIAVFYKGDDTAGIVLVGLALAVYGLSNDR